MLVIGNRQVVKKAKERILFTCSRLTKQTVFLELETNGIVEEAVSGFPVIFFCPIPGKLIIAPDLPGTFIQLLNRYRIAFAFGDHPARESADPDQEPSPHIPHSISPILYPVSYNALVTDRYLIHELPLTDPEILRSCHYLKKIMVRQGFTRSHLLHLSGNHFLTSDRGIEKALREAGQDVLCISPSPISLPGHANGGIGGCGGVAGNYLFLNGSLDFHPEGKRVRDYLSGIFISVIELTEEPLTDAGGLFFLRTFNAE
jgi:hypothetical protein